MKEQLQQVEILLVDNNLYDANLAIHTLQTYNLANRLVHLQDGREALDFIFGQNGYRNRPSVTIPQVLLIDVTIPEDDNIEVLSVLKSDERTCGIPVVVLTASRRNPWVLKCHELGAKSYIIKPLGLENLSRALAEIGLKLMVTYQ